MKIYFEYLVYKVKSNCGEFGVGSLLSIATAIIVCAFILIPGMRTFSQSIIDGLTSWWTGTIKSQIFPTS